MKFSLRKASKVLKSLTMNLLCLLCKILKTLYKIHIWGLNNLYVVVSIFHIKLNDLAWSGAGKVRSGLVILFSNWSYCILNLNFDFVIFLDSGRFTTRKEPRRWTDEVKIIQTNNAIIIWPPNLNFWNLYRPFVTRKILTIFNLKIELEFEKNSFTSKHM